MEINRYFCYCRNACRTYLRMGTDFCCKRRRKIFSSICKSNVSHVIVSFQHYTIQPCDDLCTGSTNEPITHSVTVKWSKNGRSVQCTFTPFDFQLGCAHRPFKRSKQTIECIHFARTIFDRNVQFLITDYMTISPSLVLSYTLWTVLSTAYIHPFKHTNTDTRAHMLQTFKWCMPFACAI